MKLSTPGPGVKVVALYVVGLLVVLVIMWLVVLAVR